jgi:hypothetical protein
MPRNRAAPPYRRAVSPEAKASTDHRQSDHDRQLHETTPNYICTGVY